MSSKKNFAITVNPRDVMVDMKGVSEKATKAYLHFWMLHSLHGEPLPPREEKLPRDEWDSWFRDKLDMKNVRTWFRARDELLSLGKIRQADDGRLYIGRTMRDAEKRRGGDPSKWTGGDDPQGKLCLEGVHCAQLPRDKRVDEPGEIAESVEVTSKIERTSRDVPPKFPFKSLILFDWRPALSYSNSYSHEVVAVIPFAAARARGDPGSLRP